MKIQTKRIGCLTLKCLLLLSGFVKFGEQRSENKLSYDQTIIRLVKNTNNIVKSL